MKVLYVTTILSTMGFFYSQIQSLKNKGYVVEMACNVNRELDDNIKNLGCKIHDVKFQRSPINKSNFQAFKQIQKIISEGKYDIVHLHTPVASFITRVAIKKNKNPKIIYTAHGFHFYKGAPLRNWLLYYPLEKITSKYTDVLITMNDEDYKNSLKLKLKKNGKRVKVNGVGINLDNFKVVTQFEREKHREKFGFNEAYFILFYAAELNTNKNQILLIEAVNILKKKYPNLLLLLAGKGPNFSKYEKLIQEKELEKNIKLLGYRKDVNDLLKVTDVVVASSKREGLPVNIMEAMACGLPIIATNTRGHRDLVGNGINGFLVKNDSRDFANAIESLVLDENKKKSFSDESARIVKKFEERNIFKQIEEIYVESKFF